MENKTRLSYSFAEKVFIFFIAIIIAISLFSGILWGFFGHVAR